ncbi:restriction endonuclease [Streptomyces sp. NPDC101733]|uniref:restriction endonuclease n=1 Tax=unclassified Streptomyces TaxID=2593676 RepID=UPI00382781D5
MISTHTHTHTHTHTLDHGTEGPLGAEIPFDRGPHEALVSAVLAWNLPCLEDRDYEQIALQMTGHARIVAAVVRRHAVRLRDDDGRRALAEVILDDAERMFAEPLEATAVCARARARMVRSLYARLDRLTLTPAPLA